MTAKWLSDKEMGLRYNCSRKWVWTQCKRDPDFPQPVKFSHGCTRWSAEAADKYDAKKLANAT